ncbi:MAG: hypothetical protein K2X66_17500 [Cyanobacteria bacterium]|nr:hypothetical protein [Cyanobacteriota bacterium]
MGSPLNISGDDTNDVTQTKDPVLTLNENLDKLQIYKPSKKTESKNGSQNSEMKFSLSFWLTWISGCFLTVSGVSLHDNYRGLKYLEKEQSETVKLRSDLEKLKNDYDAVKKIVGSSHSPLPPLSADERHAFFRSKALATFQKNAEKQGINASEEKRLKRQLDLTKKALDSKNSSLDFDLESIEHRKSNITKMFLSTLGCLSFFGLGLGSFVSISRNRGNWIHFKTLQPQQAYSMDNFEEYTKNQTISKADLKKFAAKRQEAIQRHPEVRLFFEKLYPKSNQSNLDAQTISKTSKPSTPPIIEPFMQTDEESRLLALFEMKALSRMYRLYDVQGDPRKQGNLLNDLGPLKISEFILAEIKNSFAVGNYVPEMILIDDTEMANLQVQNHHTLESFELSSLKEMPDPRVVQQLLKAMKLSHFREEVSLINILIKNNGEDTKMVRQSLQDKDSKIKSLESYLSINGILSDGLSKDLLGDGYSVKNLAELEKLLAMEMHQNPVLEALNKK